MRVKRVCVACNSGWMSRLEAEARRVLLPLIGGESADLSASQQLSIATWAIKTAIVFDCTRAAQKMYFSQEERDYLYRARGLAGLGLPFPPHTFVWLGAYDGNLAASAAASVLIGEREQRPDGELLPIQGHVATTSAGAFVTQVLIVRLPKEDSTKEPILHDTSVKWDRATIRIWPLRSSQTTWPPRVLLDDDSMSLEAFGVRWPRYSTKKRRL